MSETELRKHITSEIVCTGISMLDTAYRNGKPTVSTLEYTFKGTGFELTMFGLSPAICEVGDEFSIEIAPRGTGKSRQPREWTSGIPVDAGSK